MELHSRLITEGLVPSPRVLASLVRASANTSRSDLAAAAVNQVISLAVTLPATDSADFAEALAALGAHEAAADLLDYSISSPNSVTLSSWPRSALEWLLATLTSRDSLSSDTAANDSSPSRNAERNPRVIPLLQGLLCLQPTVSASASSQESSTDVKRNSPLVHELAVVVESASDMGSV